MDFITKYFKYIFVLGFVVLLLVIFVLPKGGKNLSVSDESTFWSIQSIDTVKYSRDLAREKEKDTSFDQTIDLQVKAISGTGATHIAIDTPYDEEFLPFLKRWVNAARKYGLNVWFRGNFSGWEGWFGYEPISREEHITKTKEFILSNGDLFENGDIFSACPECENGGAGDPRRTGDVAGHRKFLIDEYQITKDSFNKINKNVFSNFNPMNGDVAALIMNPETTKSLGGVVVIDHYVKDPGKLASDISEIARVSQGKVVLGEFGAPIPGIHDKMSDREQALWIKDSLKGLIDTPELIGVNYWTSFGGSSSLWKDDGEGKEGAQVLKEFYSPAVFAGVIKNEIGKPINGAKVSKPGRDVFANERGEFETPYISDDLVFSISSPGYYPKNYVAFGDGEKLDIVLVKEHESLLFKIAKLVHKIVNKFDFKP